jgi:foldase protein PrsA
VSYFRIAPVALILALAVAACGNDVPPNGVARVNDDVIKKTEFEHWINAAVRSQQPPGAGAQAAVVPDPPGYQKCIQGKQAQPVAKGQKKLDDKQAKAACTQEYNALKSQVMQFLITSDWIEQEAVERDIKPSDAVIRKQFEQQKKQSFPDEKGYQEFLKSSGQTEQDLLFRVKLDYLSNEVRKKVVAGKGNVTDADVTNYYNKNKKRFAQPERRDLSVVLTKQKGKAEDAKQALESGDSFATVAKKYSIDQASKAQGGKLPGIGKGQLEKELDKAVFSADKGELKGPVKTQFGYELFEVTKITPASQQTLAQAKETIKASLKSEREQKALDKFVKDFREKYREETLCAKGYVVSECKGGPPPQQPQQPQQGQPPPQQAPSPDKNK